MLLPLLGSLWMHALAPIAIWAIKLWAQLMCQEMVTSGSQFEVQVIRVCKGGKQSGGFVFRVIYIHLVCATEVSITALQSILKLYSAKPLLLYYLTI